jgi:Domain of unknown function (DUF4116)
MATFLDLPKDLFNLIAKSLAWRDLLALSSTNQKLKEILDTDSQWKPHFESYFTNKKTNPKQSYKQAFLAVINHLLDHVTNSSEAIQFESSVFKNDKEIILAAVTQNGGALRYATGKLKNDKDIVLAAVKQGNYALYYASEELKNDEDVVLAALNQNGYSLRFASVELRKNKDVVLAAVKQNGYALYFASDELKRDLDVVLAAVKQNGTALYYTSDELQRNSVVINAASGNEIPIASSSTFFSSSARDKGSISGNKAHETPQLGKSLMACQGLKSQLLQLTRDASMQLSRNPQAGPYQKKCNDLQYLIDNSLNTDLKDESIKDLGLKLIKIVSTPRKGCFFTAKPGHTRSALFVVDELLKEEYRDLKKLLLGDEASTKNLIQNKFSKIHYTPAVGDEPKTTPTFYS